MRRLALAALALVALAFAAWTGAWFYFAGQIEAGVDRWVADRGADGLKVGHGAVEVAGFPLGWRVRIARPEIASSGAPPWAWRGEAVTAELVPWKRGEVPLGFPGEHVLETIRSGRAGDRPRSCPRRP